MFNLDQVQNHLRDPDVTMQDLIRYVQNPTSQVPSVLALAELKRRQETDAAKNMPQAGGLPTVAQQTIAQVKPQGIQTVDPRLAQQNVAMLNQPEDRSAGISDLPLPDHMYQEKSMAAGGIVAFDDGGSVRHYAGAQGSYVLPADYDPQEEYQKYLESIQGIPSYVPGEQIPGQAALKAKKAIQATSASPYDPAIKYYESLPRSVISSIPVSQTPLGILQAKKSQWFDNASPMQKEAAASAKQADKEAVLKDAQNQIGADTKQADKQAPTGVDALIPRRLSVNEAIDMKKEALKEMGVDPEFYSKQETKNKEERDALTGDKDFAKWMAVTRAGLGIAGGKSPYGVQNLAEGATQGLTQYAGDIKDIKKSDDLLKAADRKLQEAQYLQQRGDADGAIKSIQERDKLIAEYQHYKMVADATVQAAKVGLQGKSEADLAGIYKEGVKSGEIDPKQMPWTTFKAQNMGSGVDHTNWGFQELKK